MKAVFLLLSFFSGSIPFAYILYRFFRGEDIRKRGSGNVGATNALRAGGVGIGLAAAVLDISKAAVPVYLALPYGREFAFACGLAAVVGHCFTPWLGFKGGKGVATYVGASLVSTPASALVGLGFFLSAAFFSGMVSVGSLFFALAVPIASLFLYKSKVLLALQALASLVVIYRHRSNIERVLRGKERKVWKGFM